MGISATIGVEGVQWVQTHPLVPELEDLIHDPWARRSPDGVSDAVKVDGEAGWLEIDSGQYWFGPGYPRGYWPTIRRVLEILRTMYPDARIVYGNDSSHVYLTEYPDVTVEVLAECGHFWGLEQPKWDAAAARWDGIAELRKLTGAPARECVAAFDAAGGNLGAARELIVVSSTEGSFDERGRHLPARPEVG